MVEAAEAERGLTLVIGRVEDLTAKVHRGLQPASARARHRRLAGVTSGARNGGRGVDGNEGAKGLERHVPPCSFGFALAVFVPAADLHGAQGLGPLLNRAAEAGRDLRRVEVEAIHDGPGGGRLVRHDVQVSPRRPRLRAVQRRVEATFGTLTSRCRRLTRTRNPTRPLGRADVRWLPATCSTRLAGLSARAWLALDGHPEAAYDPAVHGAAQRVLFPGVGAGYFAFFYPPPRLLLCLPLAPLPYLCSLAVSGCAHRRAVRALAPEPGAVLPIPAFL